MNDKQAGEPGLHLEWVFDEPLSRINSTKLERLWQGEELIDLSMINPDLPPPRYLLDRMVEAALKPQNHRYAVSRGIRKLREAFAVKYDRLFDVSLDPENDICVTMGSKDGLLQTLRCAAAPGESVLLANPAYPAHISAVRLAGLHPRFFELSRDPVQMQSRIIGALNEHDVKVLVINFPNNPTGISVSGEFYQRLIDECRRRSVFVINDFVYGEMHFENGTADSLLAGGGSRDNLAEIYSLSKAYCVPGWRVAAVCGDTRLVKLLSRLKSRVDYGIFLPIQLAAAAALTTDEPIASQITDEYQMRCAVVVQGLRAQGWELSEPTAGACIWARVPEVIRGNHDGALNFVHNLLTETGVLFSPGVLFGSGYDDFVRIALVRPESSLRNMLSRLQQFSDRQAAADNTSSAYAALR